MCELEELFNHDLVTINCEGLQCSMPVDAGTCEAVPSTVESIPVWGEDLDESRVTDTMQQVWCVLGW
ncbi:UNVERIFIED_CONTAM: hypothetical protein K2H54_054545 [Gekko kuhli]